MICPYNRKTQTQVTQYTNNLINEESGIISGYQQVTTESYAMLECQKENCGAWQDGRCRYST